MTKKLKKAKGNGAVVSPREAAARAQEQSLARAIRREKNIRRLSSALAREITKSKDGLLGFATDVLEAFDLKAVPRDGGAATQG